MKHIYIVISGLLLFTLSCKNSTQSAKHDVSGVEENSTEKIATLNPASFSAKMNAATGGYHLIDVRTPDEFKEKRLAGSQNIDINDPDFSHKIQGLDNTKPVFLYCLSGGRSASAMDIVKKLGFQEIYNLEGGLMKWQAESRPLETDASGPIAGMTMDDYNKIIASAPVVLVDFNAVWCGPCKKLKPHLEKLAQEGLFKLVPVDVDENNIVSQHFKIESIPLIKLYKNGQEVWSKKGFDNSQAESEIAEIVKAVK